MKIKFCMQRKALLFLCLFLTSCAHVNKDYALNNNSDSSLLVATTQINDEPCNSFFGASWNVAFDEVINPGIDKYIFFMEPKKGDEVPGVNGRMIVYELNAEEYEIQELQGLNLIGTSSTGYRFKTTEGKATYIGRVIVNVDKSCKFYSMKIENHMDSDIQLLLKRYKNLNPDDVVIDIAELE